MKNKLLRVTTVPISLKVLLKGQLRFMKDNNFDVIGVSSSGKELLDVKKDENIQIYEVDMTRTITPFRDLISLIRFYLLCKREKPFIVHSHTPKAGIIAMLGAKFANVPIRLHTVAGLPLMETKGLKRTVLNLVEKLTYSCATMVYPNSNGLLQFILKNGFANNNKLKVIGNGSSNGVDTEYFKKEIITNDQIEFLKQKYQITNKTFVFIFVGRLVGDKGINELIQAFIKLLNTYVGSKFENFKLILVGDYERDLDPLAPITLNEIQNNPHIISVGFQKDVRPFFAISNALAFPSYREGFPNVVLQAASMGLPCIVSDINGCNEIITNNLNGLVCPVKDEIGLFNSLFKMVDNTELYEKFSLNSRKVIIDSYSQSYVWNCILNEYQNYIKKK